MHNMPQALTKIRHGYNFRELGGYQTLDGRMTKYHKLLRTGNLAFLKGNELKYLRKYGVKEIIDLRSIKETIDLPDKKLYEAKYVRNPILSKEFLESDRDIHDMDKQSKNNPLIGYQHMIWAYEDMILSQHGRDAYHRFFEILLDNTQDNDAIIFHCFFGKDRTGMAAILALSALNVPLKTIKRDYLSTNNFIEPFVQKRMLKQLKIGRDNNFMQASFDVSSVKEDYFNHAMNTINQNFGNMQGFLKNGLKLTDENLNDLKAIYTK